MSSFTQQWFFCLILFSPVILSIKKLNEKLFGQGVKYIMNYKLKSEELKLSIAVVSFSRNNLAKQHQILFI